MSTPPEASDYRYWVFISYSHHDRRWAKWLLRRLEDYSIPQPFRPERPFVGENSRHIRPVFCDREELSAAASVDQRILGALAESRSLVVLCSPSSAVSKWVNDEVAEFSKLGRQTQIFSVLVAGEPLSAEPGPAPFCPALMGTGASSVGRATQPLAVDFRGGRTSRRVEFVRLVAGILGVPFDQLWRRERRRSIARLLVECVAGVLLLTVGLFVLEQSSTNASEMALNMAASRCVKSGSAAAARMDEAVRANQITLEWLRDAMTPVRSPARRGEGLERSVQRIVQVNQQAIVLGGSTEEGSFLSRTGNPEAEAAVQGMLAGLRSTDSAHPSLQGDVQLITAQKDEPLLLISGQAESSKVGAGRASVAGAFRMPVFSGAVVLSRSGEVLWFAEVAESLDEAGMPSPAFVSESIPTLNLGTSVSLSHEVAGRMIVECAVPSAATGLIFYYFDLFAEGRRLEVTRRLTQILVCLALTVLLVARAVVRLRQLRGGRR